MDQMMSDSDTSKCPLPTQDITLNLKNRAKAITTAKYGPENPALPNTPFWAKKADAWDVTVDDAKQSLCGNCAAFSQTSHMMGCIEKGLEGKDAREQDAMDVVDAGDLGFCEIFDFKCAAAWTCDAWIVGGPITDETEEYTESEEEYGPMDEEEDMSEGEVD
jgi:hypothetical protein